MQSVVQNKRWMVALLAVSALALTACGEDEGGSSSNNGGNNTASNNGDNNTAPNNGENNAANNSDVVRETTFPIGYILRNRSEIPDIEQGGNYFIVASDNSQMVRVNPDEISCHLGCQLSDDLEWFIWTERDGLETNLMAVPVLSLNYEGAMLDMAQAEIVAVDVQGFYVGGSTIAFQDSNFKVVAGELPGDNAIELATVGDIQGSQGGFYLRPDGAQVITWTVTLDSMTLSRHDLDTNETDLEFYKFESTGFGGTGSFYTSSERMSWSPDSSKLATISTALVDTNRCTNDDECNGVDEICGNNARCTSQRLTVNMISMADVRKLGEACTSDTDCGGVHFCDFSDPADANSGRCLPGRLDLGPAGPRQCAVISSGEFSDVREDVVWAPDSNSLYLLASEDCDNFNVPRSSILKVSGDLKETTPIYENPGVNFEVGNCYDDGEQQFVAGEESCVVEVEQIALAPSGETIIFTGTAPAAASANRYDLYTIDRKGERNKKWFPNEDIFKNIQNIQALKDL